MLPNKSAVSRNINDGKFSSSLSVAKMAAAYCKREANVSTPAMIATTSTAVEKPQNGYSPQKNQGKEKSQWVAKTAADYSIAKLNTESNIIEVLKNLRQAENPTRTLNLSNHSMTFSAVACLRATLKQNTKLTALTLSNCSLDDKSVTEIALALETNAHVVELDLSNNRITAVGAMMLAIALVKNKTVKQLKLNKNQLGSEGGIALLEALKGNTTLMVLELENNTIETTILSSIEQTLHHRKHNGVLPLYERMAMSPKTPSGTMTSTAFTPLPSAAPPLSVSFSPDA